MHEDILNELRTPVFLINKNNIIEYVNSIGEEFLGYSEKLIIGKHLNFFINEDSPIFNLLIRVRKSNLGLTEESLNLGNHHFQNKNVRAHILPISDNKIIVQISQLSMSEIIQKQTINSK